MSKHKKEEAVQTAQESVETPEAPETAQTDAEQMETKTAEEAAEPESYTLTAEEFKTVQMHIQQLQKEKDETVALLQRNQADFDNYRRRNASIRSDSLEEGRRECIKELLPVLDNFDRAMAADSGDEGWREGIVLVQRQLMDTLGKLGLSEIDATGAFDPNFHEAVMQEKAEGRQSGEILAVFQKGYRVGDKIVRHSMVKVAE